MSEIQQQNRGLTTKLRESAIGLDFNQNDDANDDEHNYQESMRDILNHLQQSLRDITSDVDYIKQQQQQQQQQGMNSVCFSFSATFSCFTNKVFCLFDLNNVHRISNSNSREHFWTQSKSNNLNG